MSACGHLVCELIGDADCSIATGRSRGCTPSIGDKVIAPEIVDEVRVLLAAIERDDDVRHSAVRLAEIVRREARQDRHLLAQVRTDEPELAPALERLLLRKRAVPAPGA
jgi:hypothetical protein